MEDKQESTTEKIEENAEKIEENTENLEESASEKIEEDTENLEENEEMDFEKMLAESESKSLKGVGAGQKVTAKVVMISGAVAYLDIGMRTEACLQLPEDGSVVLEEGQTLDAYVIDPSGQVMLSLEPVLGFGDFSILEDAYEKEEPVEGKVDRVIPGGYDVNIAGVRCFCPHSQINIRPVKNPPEMVGQLFPFKVIELDARSNNVVVSRRALLEEALREQLAATKSKLEVGAVLQGRVVDIRPFGAFVDFGGIQGLIHISELSYQNVERVEDVLAVDQDVTVKILDMTTDATGKERISLSTKALMPNPWDTLGIEPGNEIEGRIMRKSRFGIFINIAEGIDGLLPRRMMKKAGKELEMDSFEEGSAITVVVVEINKDEQKIALAIPGWDETIRSSLKAGDALTVEVLKVLPIGVLVQATEDPARGLIHKRTLKHQSMKQIMDHFSPGSKHEAVVENVDELGRYNFTLKGDEDEADRSVLAKFTKEQGNLGHNPFASFFNQNE